GPSAAAEHVRLTYHRGMATPDLASVRRVLLDERARLLDEIGEAIVAPGQMTYGSQAAAASQVFAQQRDLALRERSDQQLVLVDEALARLEAGTFGICVRCEGPIAVERLEALPWAARCIDCQRLAGRER
ncbi:MAG: DnaK suppressor protein, partial [Chloroflexota bacterium]|nr:DnaK suppressor protein [Chloroflexota bacterium]